jgi:MFS family permease
MATPHTQRPGAESSPSRPRNRRGGERARIANAVTTRLPKPGSPQHHGVGFWAVALTFLTLAAFTTVPSPLYGLYQASDGFSEFMVTVIYAAYAIGVVGALALAGHLSDWYGRRRLLIPAASLTIASAIVFLTWTSVPGPLLARVLSGISIGITSSTATAYLAELHARHRPGASGTRAQVTATTVNMGGLGVGRSLRGCLRNGSATRSQCPTSCS